MICPACQTENQEAHEVCVGCGQALAGGQALARGSVVASRYEILSLLGRGGMGTVFKAKDRVLDETVALKILRADVARAPAMERRFRSEIKLARRVRHRNVCGIHEYGEEGQLRYIAMELVEGTDLKALLRSKGRLATQDAYEVAIQLTQGLEAIHEAGVVHRDLKTSNVMLDSQGRVRLMDFGIAKQLGGAATLSGTAVGDIIGTPEYMSPEQARGGKIDLRSDLYGLGVVLYEIFTGHVPFHGDTPIATIFKTLEEPPTLKGAAAAGIPEGLVPVLARALAKEPGDRFGSAREMLEALKAARLETFPDAPTPTGLDTSTLLLPTGVTEVPTAVPTISATPTPTPAPTAIMRGESPEAPAPTMFAPPPPKPRRSPRPAPRSPAPRPTRRNVWPWLLGGSGLLLVLAAGVVFTLHKLLISNEKEAAIPTFDPGMLSSPGALASKAASAAPLPSDTPREAFPSATPQPEPPVRSSETTIEPIRQREDTDAAAPRPRPSPRAPRATSPAPAVATPSVAPEPSPAAEEQGYLQLRVTPWAAVSVDGNYLGTTPLQPIAMRAGSHTVRLIHPDYKPLQRKLTIAAGETTRLEIDMSWEAVPKPKSP